MKQQMKVHYDQDADFLEISLGKPTKSYATEVKPGIFIRKDEKTDEVKSIGILGFHKNKKMQDISVTLPVTLQMHIQE